MSTNDYIRQAAQKYHWHKYYSGFITLIVLFAIKTMNWKCLLLMNADVRDVLKEEWRKLYRARKNWRKIQYDNI